MILDYIKKILNLKKKEPIVYPYWAIDGRYSTKNKEKIIKDIVKSNKKYLTDIKIKRKTKNKKIMGTTLTIKGTFKELGKLDINLHLKKNGYYWAYIKIAGFKYNKTAMIEFNKLYKRLIEILKPKEIDDSKPPPEFVRKHWITAHTLINRDGFIINNKVKGLKELNICRRLLRKWKKTVEWYKNVDANDYLCFEEYENDMIIRDYIHKLIKKIEKEKEKLIKAGYGKEIEELKKELKKADDIFKKVTKPGEYEGTKWWRDRELKIKLT